MGGAGEYYMEIRCLLYMAACIACFPLYRRPGTRRSIAWLSTIICIITNFVSVGFVCVLIWNMTLQIPPDKPEIRVLRINGCLMGTAQAGALVFMSVIGIRKDGLHQFIITLKRIRNQIKSRPGKEPRHIITTLNILAAIYIVIFSFSTLLLTTGVPPNAFSRFYKETFTSFIQNDDIYEIYAFATYPLELVVNVGSGLVPFIFMATATLVRRETNIFCEVLLKYEPRLMTSVFLEETRQNHESLLTLISVTSRVFSPFYSISMVCHLSSSVFLGFYAFYPALDPMALIYYSIDIMNLIGLTSIAIYVNAGVSQF